MWNNQDEDTDHNTLDYTYCQNWAALDQLWIFTQAASQTFKTCSHLIQLEIMLWVLNLTWGHPLLNRKLTLDRVMILSNGSRTKEMMAMNGQVFNSN